MIIETFGKFLSVASIWSAMAHSLALFAAVVVPSLVYSIVLLNGYDGGPYLRGDCAYYYVTALSIAQDGDLDLSNQLPGNVENHATQVSLAVDGRIVPKHPIVMPLVSLPLVALLGPPGALGFNVIQLTALLVILYCLGARWASSRIAATSVILTGIGSVMPHYVWNYSPDIFATLLLAGAILALPAASDEISPGRHLLAGLLLGLSCVSKFPLALFLPLAIVCCTRPYRRSVPWLLLERHFLSCSWPS
jgi:4-amino-4-deoxy-L-arabinose transferase-like glycosyltransferase